MESPHLIKANAQDNQLDEQERRFLLAQFVSEDDDLMEILTGLRALDLPDWRLVSGAIYQTVWNRLTGQPQGHGIKDYDVAYFDASDRSYEAEDAMIKRVEAAMPQWQGRIELRNQARVHLWYPERFGGSYPELKDTDESLENYMCTTHAVAVRLEDDDSLSIAAPFGLEDIFALTIRPCRKLPTNRTHYAEKAKRMARHWPHLRILDWETEEPVRPDQL
ncbi:nucleotidyltransferase family protein [Cohaesibacter sp. CAU 1516]|uniref:nucleotidyltransferase family protein n=1 Tax=Cohaesibacter sp. CAU 1516 TaxID=2576038 RepID=UPI0010FDD8CC|nr:nucleotidyltransferase family protein [Cohaesibacter sp. CAU 1516]TLP47240.1 nucleotidyltransferase family protein [Cohaesibacter sp. CAU 1516]